MRHGACAVEEPSTRTDTRPSRVRDQPILRPGRVQANRGVVVFGHLVPPINARSLQVDVVDHHVVGAFNLDLEHAAPGKPPAQRAAKVPAAR